MPYTLYSTNAKESRAIGLRVGESIAKYTTGRGVPFVVALAGPLGAGKTTFVQGVGEGLGVEEKISSPTFTLIAQYAFGARTFYHIDPYRLEDPLDLVSLGLEDILSEKGSVIVIEWAELLEHFLPQGTLWVTLSYRGERERELVFSGRVPPFILKRRSLEK